MTCASSPSCRIRRGQRREASCPRRGVSSGPSGKALHPKSNVETRHTDTLRQLLGLLMDTAPSDGTETQAAYFSGKREDAKLVGMKPIAPVEFVSRKRTGGK